MEEAELLLDGSSLLAGGLFPLGAALANGRGVVAIVRRGEGLGFGFSFLLLFVFLLSFVLFVV